MLLWWQKEPVGQQFFRPLLKKNIFYKQEKGCIQLFPANKGGKDGFLFIRPQKSMRSVTVFLRWEEKIFYEKKISIAGPVK